MVVEGARRICNEYSEEKGIVMANTIEIPGNWVCNGVELKPKSGANFSNTWVMSGKEIKPKTNALPSNTWVWDGKELKPKQRALSSNTWVIENKKAKPKSGATSANTYDVGDLPILAIAGKLVLRLW